MTSSFPGAQDTFDDAATIHAKKQDGTADPSPPAGHYHSDLLGGLGDAIEAIEGSLLTGPGVMPFAKVMGIGGSNWSEETGDKAGGFYSPTATNPQDEGNLIIWCGETTVDLTLIMEDGAHTYLEQMMRQTGTDAYASGDWYAQLPDGSHAAQINVQSEAHAGTFNNYGITTHSGTAHSAAFLRLDGVGSFPQHLDLISTDLQTTITARAQTGQALSVGPLVELQAPNGTPIFSMFYDTFGGGNVFMRRNNTSGYIQLGAGFTDFYASDATADAWAELYATTGEAYVTVKAATAQTSSLLLLEDEGSNEIFRVRQLDGGDGAVSMRLQGMGTNGIEDKIDFFAANEVGVFQEVGISFTINEGQVINIDSTADDEVPANNQTQLMMQALESQTTPLVNLKDHASHPIFQVVPTPAFDEVDVYVTAPDGKGQIDLLAYNSSTGTAEITLFGVDGPGNIDLLRDPAQSRIGVRASSGQTLPLFELHDDADAAVWEMYQDGSSLLPPLGRSVAAGRNGAPTIFDPSQATWSDRGWWQAGYGSAQLDFTWGFGAHVSSTFESADTGPGGGAPRWANFSPFVESDDTNQYAYVFLRSMINADGTGRWAQVLAQTDDAGGAFAHLEVTDTHAQVAVHAVANQVDPILGLQYPSDADLLTVSLDTAGVVHKFFAPGSTQHHINTSAYYDPGVYEEVAIVGTVAGQDAFALDAFIDEATPSSSYAQLRIKAQTSQTQELLYLRDESNNPLMRVSPTVIDLDAPKTLIGGPGAVGYVQLSDAGDVGPFNTSSIALVDPTHSQYFALESSGSWWLVSDLMHVGTKIGFYGITPIVQASHPTTLGDVITILTNLGLCAA